MSSEDTYRRKKVNYQEQKAKFQRRSLFSQKQNRRNVLNVEQQLMALSLSNPHPMRASSRRHRRRLTKAKQTYLEEEAAIKIQAAFRGYCVRKEIRRSLGLQERVTRIHPSRSRRRRLVHHNIEHTPHSLGHGSSSDDSDAHDSDDHPDSSPALIPSSTSAPASLSLQPKLRRDFLRIVLEGGVVLGCVSVSPYSTLEMVRELVCSELDGVPDDFVFVCEDIPIGRNQEHKRLAHMYLPQIGIRPHRVIRAHSLDSQMRPPPLINSLQMQIDDCPSSQPTPRVRSISSLQIPASSAPAAGSSSSSSCSRGGDVGTHELHMDPSLGDGHQVLAISLRAKDDLEGAPKSSEFGSKPKPDDGGKCEVDLVKDKTSSVGALTSDFESTPIFPEPLCLFETQQKRLAEIEAEKKGKTFDARKPDIEDSSSFSPFSTSSSTVPSVSVLFSVPLAFLGEDQKLHPMPLVDHNAERELICKSFEDAKKAIRVTFNFATTDRLRSEVTLGSTVLHYSGHAKPDVLSFEDGYAGLHLVPIKQLKDLFMAGESGPNSSTAFRTGTKMNKPLLCIVSACSSRLAGEAFVEAGVQHVVCIESESEVMDRAAAVFIRAFYLALFQGLTVRAAFDIGRQAVKASPNMNPDEAAKFVLLPEGEPHLVSIFSSVSSLHEWKRPPPFSCDNIPPPPEGFLGRNVDMYHLVNKVLRHRLVSICGPKGIGKTALSLAVGNYISERQHFRDDVLFVPLTDAHSAQAVLREIGSAIQRSSLNCLPPGFTESAIISFLHRRHCLMICDNPKLEHEGIRKLLSRLLDTTRDLHIVFTIPVPITARGALFGAGEKVVELDHLSALDASRLLLRRSPRLIDPSELSCKSPKELIEKLSCHPRLQGPSKLRVPGIVVASAPLLQNMNLSTFLHISAGGTGEQTDTESEQEKDTSPEEDLPSLGEPFSPSPPTASSSSVDPEDKGRKQQEDQGSFFRDTNKRTKSDSFQDLSLEESKHELLTPPFSNEFGGPALRRDRGDTFRVGASGGVAVSSHTASGPGRPRSSLDRPSESTRHGLGGRHFGTGVGSGPGRPTSALERRTEDQDHSPDVASDYESA